MGFYSPGDSLLAPLSSTVSSGQSAAVSIGSCSAFRVKRLATSAGTLKWVAGAGTASSGYTLTDSDPDSGWIPAEKETSVTIYADSDDVVYEIARLQR